MTPSTAALCERALRMRIDYDVGLSMTEMRRKHAVPERELVLTHMHDLNLKALSMIEVDREVERLRSVTSTATTQDPRRTSEPAAPDYLQAARDALARSATAPDPSHLSVRDGEVRQDDDGGPRA